MTRLWGIRHIRYWWLRHKFALWWATVGCHLGAVPNQADLDYLEGVWKGDL
jgi:hypothetical protein